PEGGVGYRERGGGGLRDARARFRQSGSPGVGPGRGDRVPGTARRHPGAGAADARAGRRSGADGAARQGGARLRGAPVVGARRPWGTARRHRPRDRPEQRPQPRGGQGAPPARQVPQATPPVMNAPKVRDLLEQKGDPLQLEALTGDIGLDREIPTAEASSPGLVLAGYTKRFAAHRLHILGETEVTYLASLDAAARRRALETLFSFDLPCVVISKGQEPPADLVELARAKGVAVIRTRLKTAEFYRRLKPFLDDVFAPSTSVHASLADVFGVGLLFLGKSGIGKSECVLDLVERGHRLVADDVVHITRRGNDVLIGR